MAKSTQVSKSETNILDLHQAIFREIFGYLEYSVVYFTLRSVCRKLKEYVDAFVQLRGMFLLNNGTDMPTKILHILKQNNKIISLCCSKLAPIRLPTTTNYGQYWDIGSFGATFHGKIVVGIYRRYCVRKTSKYSSSLYLNEYNPKENKWIEIQPEDGNTLLNGDVHGVMSSCTIGDSILVLDRDTKSYDAPTTMRQFYLNKTNVKNTTKATTNIRNMQQQPSTLTYSDVVTPIAFEFSHLLSTLKECAIIQVEYNKAVLVGGIDNRDNLNQKLWEVKLTRKQKYLTWKAVDLEPIKSRIRPICFKLGENLYIGGGQTIDYTKYLAKYGDIGNRNLVVKIAFILLFYAVTDIPYKKGNITRLCISCHILVMTLIKLLLMEMKHLP